MKSDKMIKDEIKKMNFNVIYPIEEKILIKFAKNVIKAQLGSYFMKVGFYKIIVLNIVAWFFIAMAFWQDEVVFIAVSTILFALAFLCEPE